LYDVLTIVCVCYNWINELYPSYPYLYLAPEDDDEKEETDGEAMEMGEKIKH
jgi:hypothetical protein